MRTSVVAACLALLNASAQAATFQSLYSFSGGADGSAPCGGLVADKAGILYGVTLGGGASQYGTIFSLDPAVGVPKTLYSFSGGMDGGNPQAALSIDAHGNLYGVTPSGGLNTNCSYGCGTMFELQMPAAKLVTLYRFTDGADGAQPIAPVTLVGGTLYGSASYGGTGADCGSPGCGTLFGFKLATRTMTILRELVRLDGLGGQARMVRAPSGLLYGTSGYAGGNGSGVVFSLDPASAAYNVVHNFDYHVDGSGSDANLILRRGKLYGTMRVGGPTSAADGTIYSLDTVTGLVTTLYSFPGGTGAGLFPDQGVVAGPHGVLYGPTSQGGGSGAGTLFSFDPAKSTFALVHDFAIGDGVSPSGPLLVRPGGVMYGLTSGGGRGHGTVYKLVP